MKKYWEIIKNYNKFYLLKLFFIEMHRKVCREIIMGSFAQNYEDLIINKYFMGKKKGFYLEIGGYHPTRLSNTYFFYRRGWRGIVVEPNPEVEEIFRKTRSNDKFINLGISEKNEVLDYYKFLVPAINTFSKKEAELNIKLGHKLNKIIKIKTIKIKDLLALEKIKKIDLLSIDTEGFDELILKGWPWRKIKPRVICVEVDKNKKIEGLLNEQNYRLIYKNKSNGIFNWSG